MPGPFLISCNGLWLTFLSKLFTFLNGRECTSRTLCTVCTTGGSLNGWLGAVYELLIMIFVLSWKWTVFTAILKCSWMVICKHPPPFPSTSAHITLCTDSYTNQSAQLPSIRLPNSKNTSLKTTYIRPLYKFYCSKYTKIKILTLRTFDC